MESFLAFMGDINTKFDTGKTVQISRAMKMLIGYLKEDKEVLSELLDLPSDKQKAIFQQAIEELEQYLVQKAEGYTTLKNCHVSIMCSITL